MYYIDFGGIKDEHPTVVITTNLQHSYGVSTAELHTIALENLRDDASFTDPYEVLREFCPDGIPYELPQEDRAMMYILSNNERLNGAASILCPHVMDSIAQQIGKNFLVIPSSVHELLLVPRMDKLRIEDVRNMICDVNSSQVRTRKKITVWRAMNTSRRKTRSRRRRSQPTSSLQAGRRM